MEQLKSILIKKINRLTEAIKAAEREDRQRLFDEYTGALSAYNDCFVMLGTAKHQMEDKILKNDNLLKRLEDRKKSILKRKEESMSRQLDILLDVELDVINEITEWYKEELLNNLSQLYL